MTNRRSVQIELISPNPDFNSILNVDGKIFSVTQYESPRPGVAYVTELEQNKATGELTVWSDDEPDMLLSIAWDGCRIPHKSSCLS